MEEILDIIFKAYSHNIISLEDFTDTILCSTDGKKAETLELSCQYLFIHCPNRCKVVCVYPSIYGATAPFGPCSWYACVCVCICQQLLDLVVRSVGIIFCLSLHKVCHIIIIIPYIQYHMQWSWNKKKLKPMHKYWQ